MKKNNLSFLRNKRVLVTGHEGFVGSNLTKALIRAGARVTGIDRVVRRKLTILSPHDYRDFTAVQGDVANASLIGKVMKRNRIQVVFHLAAEALVNACLAAPRRAFSTNIRGTWNILESARKEKSVEALVIASSDKAYGSHKKLPYKEDYPLRGRHPYDVSKSCADLISTSYYHTFGLPVTVTRCGNIFGPGDFNFSRIIPDAIRCMLAGRQLVIRSDGTYTRDYIYIKDIIQGYCVLARELCAGKHKGSAWNLSAGKPLSVIDIVSRIFRVWKKQPDYVIARTVSCEIQAQHLCSAKARRLLGWKPGYSLDEALRSTIKWYRDQL